MRAPFIFVPALLLGVSLPAGPRGTATQALEQLEKRYAAARTLEARFLERYSRGPGDAIVESGTVYFSRPGRMRWEYESPQEKLFLADGKHVWFYVPADRTATRAKTSQSTDWHTPLALLAGKTRRGLFSRLCATVEWTVAPPAADAASRAHRHIRCTAKNSDAPFTSLLIAVDGEGRLASLLLREPGDVETEFRFAGWRENGPLAEVLFHFAAPAGVAIVEEASLLPRESRRP
jgi:outer membrane lipoprotein carrier protein